MIEGVRIKELRRIPDERGTIYHMLRCDEDHFEGFGEIYFSKVYPGVVKGWHIHDRMTLNYAVPLGQIKLVLYDDREDSATGGEFMEVYLGEDHYRLVQIPPLVWNGFKGVGTKAALVANCTDLPHDPDEIRRMDPLSGSISYDWSLIHR